MTENQEEMLRSVAAEGLATSFITEILLTQYIKTFPPEMRQECIDSLVNTAARTDQYVGMTQGNEEMSELWADIVIRMQGMVAEMTRRAMLRLEAGQAARRGQ